MKTTVRKTIKMESFRHLKSRFNLDCNDFDKAGVLGFDILWILFGVK